MKYRDGRVAVHIAENAPMDLSPIEPAPMAAERLRTLLRDAVGGRFPPSDLAVEFIGSPGGRTDAVVAFSGHNVVAAPVHAADALAMLPDDDPGGPMSARFLAWLGEQLGTAPGSLDVVLAAEPVRGAVPLEEVTGAAAHSRVARAVRYRDDVRVLADEGRRGVIVLGRGLAGRVEVSIELDPAHRGRGFGAVLARAARGAVPDDEVLFAQVAPGNVASLRAFLAAGYRPICSEVLFLRRGA